MNFIINCFVLMLSKKAKLPCQLFCLYKLIVLFDWTWIIWRFKVFFFFLTIFFTGMCYNSNLMYISLYLYFYFSLFQCCVCAILNFLYQICCEKNVFFLNLYWHWLDLISIQFIFHFYNYSIFAVKCHSHWVFSPINLHVRVCCGLSHIV